MRNCIAMPQHEEAYCRVHRHKQDKCVSPCFEAQKPFQKRGWKDCKWPKSEKTRAKPCLLSKARQDGSTN